MKRRNNIKLSLSSVTGYLARHAVLISFTVNTFLYSSSKPSNCNGSGYFLVDPTLQLGPNNEEINMDAIVCQTVITKLLGPFYEWLPRLRVRKKRSISAS